MPKNILCALDFSESSLQALKWTLTMAKLTHSQITVLFCYRLIGENDQETSDLKKNMENDAIRKFNDIEKTMIKGLDVSYEFITEVGFFSFRIETFIRKSPVGLLVMGNSIIQNFNEYKNLSFEHFLTSSKVPIVIVPGGD